MVCTGINISEYVKILGHHSRIVIIIGQISGITGESDIKQVSGDNMQELGVK